MRNGFFAVNFRRQFSPSIFAVNFRRQFFLVALLFFAVLGCNKPTGAACDDIEREELKSQVLRVGEMLSFELGQMRVKRNDVLEKLVLETQNGKGNAL